MASWNCEPLYGGGERCWGTGEILIDKTVKNPDTGLFVDNLWVDDPRFHPGDQITYRLEIKNTGQGNISQIKILDNLPSYLDFVSLTDKDGNGYASDWNATTRELRFSFSGLAASELRTFYLYARVFAKESLPEAGISKCLINYVSIDADGKTDSDQSGICFEKKVLGIKYLPPTGVEDLWVAVAGLLVTTIFGAKLALKKQIEN